MKTFLKIFGLAFLIIVLAFGTLGYFRRKSESNAKYIENYYKDRLVASVTLKKVLLLSADALKTYANDDSMTDEDFLKRMNYNVDDLNKAISKINQIPTSELTSEINKNYVTVLENYENYFEKRIAYFPETNRASFKASLNNLDKFTKKINDLQNDLESAGIYLNKITDNEQAFLLDHRIDLVDTDLDGLDNFAEKLYKTDENNPDTDRDGINDGDEVHQGTNPNGSGFLWDVYKI